MNLRTLQRGERKATWAIEAKNVKRNGVSDVRKLRHKEGASCPPITSYSHDFLVRSQHVRCFRRSPQAIFASDPRPPPPHNQHWETVLRGQGHSFYRL